MVRKSGHNEKEIIQMKKIPMLLLLAAPYIFIMVCAKTGLKGSVLLMWVFLCALVYLPNMVYAFILPRLGYEGEKLLFWSLLLKLANIPVYGLVILLVLLLNIFILPMTPFLVLFDYSLLLPSSMYGVSGILSCHGKGKLSGKERIVHIIMQFMFCLDVASAVYCYVKVKKR